MPVKVNKVMDPNITYQKTMGEMKKKKWALNQRINYEGQKDENIETVTKIKEIQSEEKIERQNDGDNKVVVNERFKQFLLE